MEYKYKYLYFILYIGSHVHISYSKDESVPIGNIEVVIIQIFILYLDSHFIFIR